MDDRRATGRGQCLTGTIQSRLRPARCLLCDRPACCTGYFQPHDQRAFLAPPGKVRALIYSLCRTCLRRPNVVDAVERVLTAQFRATLQKEGN
jgi:hypothetical protein